MEEPQAQAGWASRHSLAQENLASSPATRQPSPYLGLEFSQREKKEAQPVSIFNLVAQAVCRCVAQCWPGRTLMACRLALISPGSGRVGCRGLVNECRVGGRWARGVLTSLLLQVLGLGPHPNSCSCPRGLLLESFCHLLSLPVGDCLCVSLRLPLSVSPSLVVCFSWTLPVSLCLSSRLSTAHGSASLPCPLVPLDPITAVRLTGAISQKFLETTEP